MSCMPICSDGICSNGINHSESRDIETNSINDTPLIDNDPSFVSKDEAVENEKTKIEVENVAKHSKEEDDKTTDDEESHEDDDLEKTAPVDKRRRNIFIASGVFVALILIIVLATTLGGKDDGDKSIAAGKGDKYTDDNEAAVDKAIRNVAIFGGKEFEDKESYQSKALAWLKEDTSGRRRLSSTGKWSEEQLIQRYALASLYYSTFYVPNLYFYEHEIGGWIEDENWLTKKGCDDWYGVTCTDDIVEKIVLYENGLTGSLPREVSLLSSLNHLDVGANKLFNYGAEGNEWLGDMTSLEKFSYGENYFDYDGIPTQISKLTNLVEYDCSYTLYHGPLKDEAFAGLNKLKMLDISGNEFNSSIPDTLASLPNLERLYAMEATLLGSFEFVTKMQVIKEMWVDYNGIDGMIPPAIEQIKSLNSLSVGDNRLSGPIPKEMGKLTNLVQLWLYDNSLTGSIPEEVRALTNLETLYFSGNDISGAVPDGVCNLKTDAKLEKLVVDCGGDAVTCKCCDSCDYESS